VGALGEYDDVATGALMGAELHAAPLTELMESIGQLAELARDIGPARLAGVDDVLDFANQRFQTLGMNDLRGVCGEHAALQIAKIGFEPVTGVGPLNEGIGAALERAGGAALLHDMGQLVRQDLFSLPRVGIVFAGTKEDVLPGGEGARAQ